MYILYIIDKNGLFVPALEIGRKVHESVTSFFSCFKARSIKLYIPDSVSILCLYCNDMFAKHCYIYTQKEINIEHFC